MRTFIKVQAVSILGSIADFLITFLLTEFFNSWYLLSNFAGNTIGGIIQFFLCRNWAFQIEDDKMRIQMMKFIVVFIGNLLLSAAGVYLFTSFFKVNYLLSKTFVSVLLGVSYNYVMQKRFVFRDNNR